MYKYIKCYYMGYEEGMKDAFLIKRKKTFKKINDKEIMSKLYDIGYINGFTNNQKTTLKNNKNIV